MIADEVRAILAPEYPRCQISILEAPGQRGMTHILSVCDHGSRRVEDSADVTERLLELAMVVPVTCAARRLALGDREVSVWVGQCSSCQRVLVALAAK